MDKKCTRTKDINGTKLNKLWIYGTSETCDLFGVSAETLNNWVKRGAPKEGYGKWNIKELIKWKYGEGKEESAEVRKLKAEADLKESKAAQEAIKLAITEGRYVPVDKVTRDLRRLFGVLKKSLLAIGHSVATEINSIDKESALAANKIIDEKIHEALEQLSRSGIYKHN